mgnify:CR=1 FL=1
MFDSFITTPIINIFKILFKFITGKSYEFLEKNIVIKYSLCVIVSIVLILCLILILFNSFKGISQILKSIFPIDAYEYIKRTLDVDIEGNVDKLFIPELIVSSLGLASLISILLYIVSFEKSTKKEFDVSFTNSILQTGLNNIGLLNEKSSRYSSEDITNSILSPG